MEAFTSNASGDGNYSIEREEDENPSTGTIVKYLKKTYLEIDLRKQ